MKYLRHLKYLFFEELDRYHWQYHGTTTDNQFYIVKCRCGLSTLEKRL